MVPEISKMFQNVLDRSIKLRNAASKANRYNPKMAIPTAFQIVVRIAYYTDKRL
jgi:hypothetical protein